MKVRYKQVSENVQHVAGCRSPGNSAELNSLQSCIKVQQKQDTKYISVKQVSLYPQNDILKFCFLNNIGLHPQECPISLGVLEFEYGSFNRIYAFGKVCMCPTCIQFCLFWAVEQSGRKSRSGIRNFKYSMERVCKDRMEQLSVLFQKWTKHPHDPVVLRCSLLRVVRYFSHSRSS